MEVVACAADIVAAFQGSAEFTRKLHSVRRKKKDDFTRFLEQELQLALEKAKDELTEHKQLFVKECGYTVPGKELFVHHLDQLFKVKSSVEAFYALLQHLFDNECPLKDPRKSREDADRWRFTAVQAMTELRMRVQQSKSPASPPTASHPVSSYFQPSPPSSYQFADASHSQRTSYPTSTSAQPLSDNHRPLSRQLPSPSISLPPIGGLAIGGLEPPPQADSADSKRSSRDLQDTPLTPSWSASPQCLGRFESALQQQQHQQHQQHQQRQSARAVSPDVPCEDSPTLPAQRPPNSPQTLPLRVLPSPKVSAQQTVSNGSRRDSVLTSHTSSTGSHDQELVHSPLPERRDTTFLSRFVSQRRKSSVLQSTIECTGDVIRGVPSKRNNWHGFCPAAFEILENPSSGLEVIKRPFNMTSNRLFLQCKKCAFPGHHCGARPKDKTPDPAIMVSANGIRFRWMFLAKSHGRSVDDTSGEIRVHEQIGRNAYRCIFCYLDGTLPDKLGGLATLMNHIWQHHRQRNMNPNLLRRAGCIIGREASASEAFDINIPTYAEVEVKESTATKTGGVVVASSLGLSVDEAEDRNHGDNGRSSDEFKQLVSEMQGGGRRGSPVELMGSCQSYLISS